MCADGLERVERKRLQVHFRHLGGRARGLVYSRNHLFHCHSLREAQVSTASTQRLNGEIVDASPRYVLGPRLPSTSRSPLPFALTSLSASLVLQCPLRRLLLCAHLQSSQSTEWRKVSPRLGATMELDSDERSEGQVPSSDTSSQEEDVVESGDGSLISVFQFWVRG